MKIYQMLFFIFTPALLVGCATDPIIDFASPKSISIRYDPMLVSPQSAGKVAQQHCQTMGQVRL